MLQSLLCDHSLVIAGLMLACVGLLLLTAVRLPSLFSDHMVLQRQFPIDIWGTARPGERVTVVLADQRAMTQADDNGAWIVHLDAMEAGGPHELCVKGQEGPAATACDVWVGEVWVCSGQSNMEWRLSQAAHAEQEIPQADYPKIRFFSVPVTPSATPLADTAAQWSPCTPDVAGNYSAVAYFFSRHLHKMLEVPVGLLISSLGGTLAEAWTSRAGLETFGGEVAKPILDRFDAAAADYPRRKAEYEQALAEWERRAYHQDPGNRGVELGWARPEFDISDWGEMALPQMWERTGLMIDGAVWFRREIEIPLAWAGKDLSLHLGPIDDFDHTYFNGTLVGGTGADTRDAYRTPRCYTVPGSLVKAGKNHIAVRVFDRFGEGGFGGVPYQVRLGPADAQPQDMLSLAGPWRYKIELALEPLTALPPGPAEPLHGGAPHAPAALYNGMIRPLIPYAIRGAIWYQGESNVERAEQYRTLFPALIKDWRKNWGQGDFPFLFVQLANFMPGHDQPVENDWAELREAQLLTLDAVPRTGMAVAIDIGEEQDIHPKNKQDVGTRLALAAAAIAYERNIVHSGPIYDSMKVEDARIRLLFKHTGTGLVAKGGQLKGFAIAGADRKFLWADAQIDGETIVVRHPQIPQPLAVRYGWDWSPAVTLYNREGLPASPFRTDDWPLLTAGRR